MTLIMSEESGKVFMDYSHRDGPLPRIIENPKSTVLLSPHSSPHSTPLSLKSHDDKSMTTINESFKCSHSMYSIKTSSLTGDETPSYESQPWFYGDMTREEASQFLQKYGTIDGVFLVRSSHSNAMTFVLSFVFNWKVYHIQIQRVDEKGQNCLSLDSGRTKFYDLLQLIEFYQLNYGVLPTKLTYFLVHPKYNH